MIKRGLVLTLVILLFSTIVSALTSQDYYNFFNVKDLSGVIVKAVLFVILALLVYRGISTTIFKDNQAPSWIIALLLSFLMVKSFSASITEILVGIAILILIFFIVWLITKAVTNERATPSKKIITAIIVFIVILILFFIFLSVGKHLGYKGIYDYPVLYTITNYIDYFFQAEIFFDISQAMEGFRIFGIGFYGLIIAFIVANIFAIIHLINLLRKGKYNWFIFWLILYIVILFIIFGYPDYFY